MLIFIASERDVRETCERRERDGERRSRERDVRATERAHTLTRLREARVLALGDDARAVRVGRRAVEPRDVVRLERHLPERALELRGRLVRLGHLEERRPLREPHVLAVPRGTRNRTPSQPPAARPGSPGQTDEGQRWSRERSREGQRQPRDVCVTPPPRGVMTRARRGVARVARACRRKPLNASRKPPPPKWRVVVTAAARDVGERRSASRDSAACATRRRRPASEWPASKYHDMGVMYHDMHVTHWRRPASEWPASKSSVPMKRSSTSPPPPPTPPP